MQITGGRAKITWFIGLVVVSLTIMFMMWNDPQYGITEKLLQKTTISASLNYTTKELNYQFGKFIWSGFQPKIKCPNHLLQRIGRKGDGGKWTCGARRLPKKASNTNNSTSCLIYSFGVSSDSSFEAEILRNEGTCEIYAYDPSVRKIGRPLSSSDSRVQFKSIGIGGSDMRKQKTLRTLMKNNGHLSRWITILKMDIEHGEYAALDRILEDFPVNLPFEQLLVEVHVSTWQPASFRVVLDLFEKLEKRGVSMFHQEFNALKITQGCCSEFSLLNLKSPSWSHLVFK